ncbi:MAG: DUF929 domain-containing protein [Candidatus Marsarchaeota archaeon]|nr:DUF929 domain-containing protein [Candidatus Marsarchaeota archaeon]
MEEMSAERKGGYVPIIAVMVVVVAAAIAVSYMLGGYLRTTAPGHVSAATGANASAQSTAVQNPQNPYTYNAEQTKAFAALAAYDNDVVPRGMISELHIPENESNSIGIGSAPYPAITLISGKPELASAGKPEVLYIGAEYCPYCAAERWAMVIALMRFGNFSNLHLMTSSAADTPPSIPTFTFYNSTYTSQYITFVSDEQTTNKPSQYGYVPLQAPTPEEQSLESAYDNGAGIPFLLFANRSVEVGATIDPSSVLYGRNWTTVVQELYNTSSAQAQSIIGSADLLTEQICSIDNNTPAGVCSQPYVTSIRKLFGS